MMSEIFEGNGKKVFEIVKDFRSLSKDSQEEFLKQMNSSGMECAETIVKLCEAVR